MARAFVYSKFLAALFLGLVIESCKIEEAKSETSKKLVIASDFLEAKDTLFFKRFSKKTGVRLKIINLNASQIAQKLNKERYNSSIDLVFVNSLQSVKVLETIQFQKLNTAVLQEKIPFLKAFKKNTWLVAGLDPFVFSYIPDSTNPATTYSDLANNFSWSSPQSIDEFSVLLAQRGSLAQKNVKWKKKFIENNVSFNSESDSLKNRQFLVVKHSFLKTDKSLSKNKKRVLFFPKEKKSACFADRWCFAIVNQAKNYESAEIFIVYYSKLSLSNYFRKRYGVFSGFEDSKNPKILMLDEDILLKSINL